MGCPHYADMLRRSGLALRHQLDDPVMLIHVYVSELGYHCFRSLLGA